MKLHTLYIYIVALFLVGALPVSAQKNVRRQKMEASSSFLPDEQDELPPRARPDCPLVHTASFSIPQKKEHKANINSRFMQGIDVSHYQNFINWDAVAASEQISYVYLKATEGREFVDNTYERNNYEARRVGLSVGAYHFYRPNVPWEQQFELIKRIIKKEDQDLAVMIDVEVRTSVSYSKFIEDLIHLVQAVTEHYDCPPLIYTYQYFYNQYLSKNLFPGCTWMMAAYKETPPNVNDGFDFETWQYTDNGRIPGITGAVDRSCIMPGHTLHEMRMK